MEQSSTAGKTFEGVVVKASGKHTVSVLVERYVKHPRYGKYMRRSQKFLVHDPEDKATVGEKVVIRESRPISRRKHFVLVK